MSAYNQLTNVQGCQIEALIKTELWQRDVASVVGVCQSTISRELKHNRGQRGCRSYQAHSKTVPRRRDCAEAHVMHRSWLILLNFY